MTVKNWRFRQTIVRTCSRFPFDKNPDVQDYFIHRRRCDPRPGCGCRDTLSGKLVRHLGFTVVANALLFNRFRRRALYFDTFIGLFLWLGFWLKLSVRIAFSRAVQGADRGV